MYLFNYLLCHWPPPHSASCPGASAVFEPDEKAPPVQVAEGDTTTCAKSGLSWSIVRAFPCWVQDPYQMEIGVLGRFLRRPEEPGWQSIYPELEEAAREWLAVNQYLQQLEHPQGCLQSQAKTTSKTGWGGECDAGDGSLHLESWTCGCQCARWGGKRGRECCSCGRGTGPTVCGCWATDS